MMFGRGERKMKESQGKIMLRKKYIIALLFCVLAIFVVVLILSKKNSKESDIVAIHVQEQGSDDIFTSEDDGLSWIDGNVPEFFMTTQKKEIRRNEEKTTVTIQNKSDDVVIYEKAFYLYKWSKNTWVPYEPSEDNWAFTQWAYLLQPNSSCDMECNLQHYEFKRGKYLLKKSVCRENEDIYWDLSVEFVVK